MAAQGNLGLDNAVPGFVGVREARHGVEGRLQPIIPERRKVLAAGHDALKDALEGWGQHRVRNRRHSHVGQPRGVVSAGKTDAVLENQRDQARDGARGVRFDGVGMLEPVVLVHSDENRPAGRDEGALGNAHGGVIVVAFVSDLEMPARKVHRRLFGPARTLGIVEGGIHERGVSEIGVIGRLGNVHQLDPLVVGFLAELEEIDRDRARVHVTHLEGDAEENLVRRIRRDRRNLDGIGVVLLVPGNRGSRIADQPRGQE